MTIWAFAISVGAISATFSVAMSLAWLIRRWTGNSGWIDATWTFTLGSIGVFGALAPLSGTPWPTERQVLVAVLIAAWALRLGTHVVARIRRTSDDPRYAALAVEWGQDASRRMFIFCQQQAGVTVVLALAMLLAAQNPAPGLRLQDIIAVAVLALAIAGESIADADLRRFASDPANRRKVCDVGLWRWSRHPNYFFEWLGWCAFPLFAIDLSGHYPWGWLSLAGPVCMYWLLAHVSGIPPLEQHMLRTRGDAFRDYQQRTSAFFPMPSLKRGCADV
jgi:steroid 5-alpha reductase family enzyme